jgi:hypothetical protein
MTDDFDRGSLLASAGFSHNTRNLRERHAARPKLRCAQTRDVIGCRQDVNHLNV